MIFNEEKYTLNGREIVLRCAGEEDADTLIDYLKKVTGETDFLLCYPDEVSYTTDSEIAFISNNNESETDMLMLAFVDGKYAGNCSFRSVGKHRRFKHRADLGIALFLEYTGFGLGQLMLKSLLNKMKDMGYEQAELEVASGNDRAYHVYEKLGFKEVGRTPNAFKYDDGTYADEIKMVLPLTDLDFWELNL